jgi:hypothetical protein
LPKNLSPLLLRGSIGFLVGLAVWAGLSAPYTRVLAPLSEFAIRLGEQPPVTYITLEGSLMMIDRTDISLSPSSVRLGVETTEITFNFILLMTLFAARARALTDRNVVGFLCAAAALVFVHVAGVVAFVKADYAVNLGAWSAAHYGVIARTFWEGAPRFYSVVGANGSAVALWWLLRESSSPTSRSSSSGRARQGADARRPQKAPRRRIA